MKPRKVLANALSLEAEVEFGVVVRAVHDLCASLNLTGPNSRFVIALLKGLVRGALVRAKPNRQLAYLSQWRQFLCSLPDRLALVPREERMEAFEKALGQFHLEDRRGRTKPAAPLAAGANCFLTKDGELWYAKVPSEDMPQIVYPEPPPAKLKRKFLKGEQIYKKEKIASAINTDRAEYFRPYNPPAVLKKEYRKLIRVLPESPTALSEDLVAARVPDIPARLISDWIKDGVSRSDLALLLAARRARMTAKVSNLPHLHEALRWAR